MMSRISPSTKIYFCCHFRWFFSSSMRLRWMDRIGLLSVSSKFASHFGDKDGNLAILEGVSFFVFLTRGLKKLETRPPTALESSSELSALNISLSPLVFLSYIFMTDTGPGSCRSVLLVTLPQKRLHSWVWNVYIHSVVTRHIRRESWFIT